MGEGVIVGASVGVSEGDAVMVAVAWGVSVADGCWLMADGVRVAGTTSVRVGARVGATVGKAAIAVCVIFICAVAATEVLWASPVGVKTKSSMFTTLVTG